MNSLPWSHLISTDAIFNIHQSCIEKFGGDSSPDPLEGCVERSLGAAWTAELYAGSESALRGLCFAGCLLYYLAMNHCFVDGNKRVAWASCVECLRQLGLTVSANDDEAEEFCLKVVAGEIKNAVEVSMWFAPRLTAIEED